MHWDFSLFLNAQKAVSIFTMFLMKYIKRDYGRKVKKKERERK
jgi:hypothetical protein